MASGGAAGHGRAGLTGRGYAVLGAAVVLGAGGWALGYPELVVLSTGCAVALLVAIGWIAVGHSLQVSRQVAPAKVPRGEAAVATVHVSNTGRRGTRPLVAEDRCGTTTVHVDIPALGPGTARFSSYRIDTSRRGEQTIGPLLLRAGDPLGLVSRVFAYGEPATLLVRPRTVPLPPLPSGRTASIEGPTSDTAPSGTITFHALREYVLGDELRHVHWRSSARTGKLMVRQLVDSSLPLTTIVLDTRAASYAADAQTAERDFDLAVDAVATVAAAMATLGYPVTLLGTDGSRYEVLGQRTTGALLDRLARTVTTESGDLPAGLETARRSSAGGSLTVITGTAAPLPAGRLAACRNHFHRTALIRAGATPLSERPLLRLPVPVIEAARAEDVAAAWRRAGQR
jgi:uncharacterized protein (DUF58 family)